MTDRPRVVRKRLGELLIEREVITQEQLQEALSTQSKNKKLLGEILVDLGYATEEEIMICLTAQYGIPYLPVERYEVEPDIISLVPAELVRKYRFIPIDKISNLLTIIASDILDTNVVDELENVLKCKIQSYITAPSALEKAINKYYGSVSE